MTKKTKIEIQTAWNHEFSTDGNRIDKNHRVIHGGLHLFIEEGARMILIDTEADNEKALRFFKKEGFSNPNEHVYLSRNLTRDPEYLKRKRRTSAPGKSRTPNNSRPKPQRP